eukprot:365011-Chlamydomonas_euryale.AAC.20
MKALLHAPARHPTSPRLPSLKARALVCLSARQWAGMRAGAPCTLLAPVRAARALQPAVPPSAGE